MNFFGKQKACSSQSYSKHQSPLARSELAISIDDLLAVYELRHVFRNGGDTAIEAVYSFPIPLDAAFLGMEAVLAGERRVAEVLAAREASRRYDDALAQGDSAVLLERIEQGMLCVNLGNLAPGEEGQITLRFAASLSVADSRARFSLPLVHRPRYGRTKLDERVEPQHDFAVEHPLQAQIRVRGLLATCAVSCATPGVKFQSAADELLLKLDGAMLDRDFVLAFDLPDHGAARARWIADGEQSIGVLSFVPAAPPTERTESGLDLCLLLDGSGSMSGDAIAQSRQALLSLAHALDESDRIQVMRFGSSVVRLFRRPLQASMRVKESLAALATTVDADLGGTEMGDALNLAIDALQAARETNRPALIILVTDGAVQPAELEAAQRRAQTAGVRIFVVAVGSSAGVDVLAPLATATQGTLERAVPAEPIDAAVMRQLRRARAGAPLAIQINWGEGVEALPLGIVYPGDAVTAIARLPDQNRRTVRVSLPAAASVLSINLAELEVSPERRVWCAQQCYLHADERSRASLALRYGLITNETSAVLVKVRADGEKIDSLPVVVPVAHMQPMGLGSQAASYAPFIQFSRKNSGSAGHLAQSSNLLAEGFSEAYDSHRMSAPDDCDPESASIDSQLTLSAEQVQRVGRLLFHALLDVLGSEPADSTLAEEVMARIAQLDLQLVKQYLRERGLSLATRADALELLNELQELDVACELTDDQEALLSMLGREFKGS